MDEPPVPTPNPGALDPDELTKLTDAELTDAFRQLVALNAMVERQLLEVIRQIDAKDLWRRDGARRLTDWIVEAGCVSRPRAASWAEVAVGLPRFPELNERYESGEATFDQVRPFVGVAAGREGWLAENIAGWSVRQCERLATQLRRDDDDRVEPEDRTRSLRYFWKRDRFHFRGELGDEAGAVVEEALERLAEQAPTDPETGDVTPYEERCADALAQLASEYLGREQEDDADVATVICHLDPATVAGLEGEAELDGGHPIPGETARRLLCDCRFQVVRENENGEVIGLGRMTRIVPSWLKRQLDHRDGGCRFPGCPRTSWVDRHHVVFWANGGRTDPGNLVSVCRLHHRLMHEGGWTIEGDPAGQVRFVSPSGVYHTSVPTPRAPRRPRRSGPPESPPRPPVARPEVLERLNWWSPESERPKSPSG